jgi:hypothetical protein
MVLRLARLAVVLVAVLVPFALVSLAQGATRGAAGPLTTEPEVYEDLNVTITDRKIVLSERRAERGEGVTLHVKNTGKKPHSFSFAGKGAIALGNAGLSTPVLKPGQTYILSVFMDVRGAIPYRSTVKADASRIGMRGVFFVI